jgi:hypothetical protein
VGFNQNAIFDIGLHGNVQSIEKGQITMLDQAHLNYSGFYCMVNKQLKLFYYTNNNWFQRLIARTAQNNLWLL